uniref:putative bifunctional diguanylate cyclase/phosphodiesterase n=1 Tax=Ningiella ruwaisensis TaxID=2364274 RepID=UPI00109FAF87|nr:bifunctional diguanylate cyclase/phosphodiesterase [Ningiella ruwaisensis]
MHLSLIQSLGILDCVVLKRSHDEEFAIVQHNSAWFTAIFGAETNARFIHLHDQSLFLSDFLLDAQDFWDMHSTGQIQSGVWTEIISGEEYYLEAIAASSEHEQYLVIKNVEQQFKQQRQTLQVARELLISNDEIVERHDYLNERLRSILINNASEESGLPLYEAIQFADIGVIILDEKKEVMETNPAAYRLFEMRPGKDKAEVFNILYGLLNRQYPEKPNLFTSSGSFSGELYWHQPPITHKWLKIDILCVESGSGEHNYWVLTLSDITRVKYLMQTNEELVLHDSLTGLPNRQYFWKEISQLVDKNQPFFILNIDIVNFKHINELLGYIEGDEILKQACDRMNSVLGRDFFMTRIGADEFMIIQTLDNNANAARPGNAETIEKDFETKASNLGTKLVDLMAAPFYSNEGKQCELGIKVGISQFPRDASTAEGLLSCADIALNAAKNDFSKSIKIYSDKLKVEANRRLKLEAALKRAIEKEEFALHLQPIFDLESGKIMKAEALLRWQLDGENISPDEFIPIAERSALINTIGRWVIQQACTIQAHLNSININIPLSLNFSPKQIHDIKLINFIRECIDKTKIDATFLELEMTEGVLVHNYDKVRSFLNDIKQTGLGVSVDDFGTGYSSLSYLKHLPIDSLKIDRSFIDEVALDEDDQAIVGAILAMASALKLNVVAEGVETDEQKSYLLANRCLMAQGFIFSKALPLDEFISFLKKQKA